MTWQWHGVRWFFLVLVALLLAGVGGCTKSDADREAAEPSREGASARPDGNSSISDGSITSDNGGASSAPVGDTVRDDTKGGDGEANSGAGRGSGGNGKDRSGLGGRNDNGSIVHDGHRDTGGSVSNGGGGTVLNGHSLPPSGVEITMSPFGGAAPPERCADIAKVYSGTAPGIFLRGEGWIPDRMKLDIGDIYQFCLGGFTPGSQVEVSITAPDGRPMIEGVSITDDSGNPSINREICYFCPPDGYRVWDNLMWSIMPDIAPGDYRVVATGGEQTWSGVFHLLPTPLEPLIRIVNGRAQESVLYKTGDEFVIVLAGFGPSTEVSVDFYYYGDYGHRPGEYRTTVPVRMNVQGNAMYRLQADADDPRGYWGVRVRPEIGSRAASETGFAKDTFRFTDKFCLL